MHSSLYSLWGLIASTMLYPLAERHQKRDILKKYKALKEEAADAFVIRKQRARERLVGVLQHAEKTVPYYRDLFAAYRFTPEKVLKDLRYFEELPHLTKDILREQGERLVSEPYAHAIVRRQKTGSSTGPAATIFYSQEDLDWTAAQNILMLGWGGKRRWDREVHLSTRFAGERPPAELEFEWKKCLILNRFNIFTTGFDDASQERLLDDLRKAKARVVQGHPSSLFALARYLKKKGRTSPDLFGLFVSTGEMMRPDQREHIETVLGVKVVSRYGACEFGVMAQELAQGPKNQLLCHDSMVWPEAVPVKTPDGETASELVFTNLKNTTMPLIRYRMGDVGTLEEREDGWWLTELTGRVHDNVWIDGVCYPTHYIQDILDRCGPISDFQILVKDKKALEFRLVTDDPGAWPFIETQVKSNFPSIPVRCIKPEELVFVGIRGKFSYLVREA